MCLLSLLRAVLITRHFYSLWLKTVKTSFKTAKFLMFWTQLRPSSVNIKLEFGLNRILLFAVDGHS